MMTNPMTYDSFRNCLNRLPMRCGTALLLLLFLGFTARLQAQCNPDMTPPTVVAVEFTTVAVGADGTVSINAITFDDGSYDECCLDTILVSRLEDGPCDGDATPDAFAGSVTFCCADIGTSVTIVMRVVDCAGNVTDVLTIVEVVDKLKPVCVAPANVSVTCSNFDPTLATYGAASASSDNCCLDTIVTQVNGAQFDSLCNRGTIVRQFTVADCYGNTSRCSQTIQVGYEQHYFVKMPNDLIVNSAYVPGTTYGEPTYYGEDCELLAHSYYDETIGGGSDTLLEVQRTWSIINWCTYDPNLPFVQVPNPTPNALPNHPANLPGPVVSNLGPTDTLVAWRATVVKIAPTDPAPTSYTQFYNANANGYQYVQILKFQEPMARITGTVFLDEAANCTYEIAERGLQGWKVRFRGASTNALYEATTKADGRYETFVATRDAQVEGYLASAINYGQTCASNFKLQTATGQVVRDIPVQLTTQCPILAVDLQAASMVRCANNTYIIKASNLGAAPVANANVEVQLDRHLQYVSSSLPATSLGNNRYAINLGTLQPGASFAVNMLFKVDCDAPAGYTHRSTASLRPYSVCSPSPTWSGADLEVTGVCDADSVRFLIRNVGIGNMSTSQEFVVVEDVIMYRTFPVNLAAGTLKTVSFPNNGATWRVMGSQVPQHPWGGSVSYAVEGCGGLRQTGLVNVFPNSPANPFEAVDTRQNQDVVMPIEKTAIPTGYGPNHLIKPNTDLDYIIVFQNRGDAVAKSVVVTDTLPVAWLDMASLRPGASSHPYNFSVNGNVVQFRFDNIGLPAEKENDAASRGFIRYRVAQKLNNPIGTRIQTRANIRFQGQNGSSAQTNTTLHTIGNEFIPTGNREVTALLGALQVSPNPARTMVTLAWSQTIQDARLELVNAFGQVVRSEQVNGTQHQLQNLSLPAGTYGCRLVQDRQVLYTGKVVLMRGE